MMRKRAQAMRRAVSKPGEAEAQHQSIFVDVSRIIDAAKASAARSVNAFMTATFWMIGRHIVEFEQKGPERAGYGGAVVEGLSADFTARYDRGFTLRNVWRMNAFYVAWPILPTALAASLLAGRAHRFLLLWSSYVRLLSVKNLLAQESYETEAPRGGWSIHQIDRQINSRFYARTALSQKKAALLPQGQQAQPDDTVLSEGALKDPYVIEFLDLEDEHSETDLEAALIRHQETFLLDLGGDFCFMGMQRHRRIGNEWCRLDLLFFHRRLRCLVVIDLEIGRFTHADAGQMPLYLNYARVHWVHDGENPPVGLILRSHEDDVVAEYVFDGLPN